MSSRFSFQQVDVFADNVGHGNPVAVVLDAERLSDDEMARFAAWTNLSETTFVLPPTDPSADYRVRIFTPVEELPFAGHPTLGTAHAVRVHRGLTDDSLVQECGAGLVNLEVHGGRLSFATPPLLQSGPLSDEEEAWCRSALAVDDDLVIGTEWIDNGPGWVGVQVKNVEVLRSLRPTLKPDEPKIGVAALTGTRPELEVRAFFEAGGTREDPVTGSLNGSLAQWLIPSGVLPSSYVAAQGEALGRRGRIHVRSDEHGAIWVGGDTVTGIEGTVSL